MTLNEILRKSIGRELENKSLGTLRRRKRAIENFPGLRVEINALDKAIAAKASKPLPPLQRAPDREAHPDCETCQSPETFKPSHNGSVVCESGSIASGGQNAHCTCDVCF